MVNIQRNDFEPAPRQMGIVSAPLNSSGGRLPPAPAVREALVLGAAEGAAAITAGLIRAGVTARLLDYADPTLRSRLLDPRPDLVILDTSSVAAERAAAGVLETMMDGLRTLTVPVLAAIGPGTHTASDMLLQVDDVLLPPHDAAEALFRTTLVARRRGHATAHLISAGALTVDVEGFRAWLAGEPITLTYTEFQLLRLLLLNRGKVLTRQVLLNKIWGYDYLGGLRTVDVHIRRLRAKIEAEAPALIETVRHVGYRISD